VVLLFRLFAMEMSEKYKMERVMLTEEAKQMLRRYKWPGNIRQLKSVTEQISIFSKERTITPEILAKFIPQDQDTTQLATIPHESGDHSFENEREILYKILFELRGNVNDMRREMGNLKKRIEEVQNLKTIPVDSMTGPQLAPISPIRPLSPTLEDAVAEEYVEPEKEPESLNLNVLGKQMLEKALDRNNGNRKKAAQELGISDRTLYRRLKQYGLVCLLSFFCLLSLSSCKVSYTFNGASIDYTKIKSIQIADFPVRSSYVWAPMGAIFNNQLKDQFRNSTKLSQVKRNGDLKLEGEITRYEQRNKAVTADAVSAQVELSITVNVRFTNNKDHTQDFEKQFTTQKAYDSTLSLSAVQEELVTAMVKDLCDQIFNATVANW
jgi:AraC-like DNA-binding protein